MNAKQEQNINPRYWDEERQAPNPVYPSEVLFATMCLADPALVPHGESLLKLILDRAQANHNTSYISRVLAPWNRLGATRAGAPNALANGLPPRWHSITPGAVWFAQDGYLLLLLLSLFQPRLSSPQLLD